MSYLCSKLKDSEENKEKMQKIFYIPVDINLDVSKLGKAVYRN